MSIDTQLLRENRINKKEESRAGSEIRKNKVKNRGAKASQEKSENKDTGKEKEGLRQRLLSGTKGNEKSDKKKKKNQSSLSFPLHKGSKMAMRWSWITLLVTGGLSMAFSLAYLNFHLLFRNIMPSFFCKPGEEWSMREEVNKARSTAASKMGKKALGVFEILGIILLDAITVIFFILMASVLVTVIVVIYKFFDWFQNFFSFLG